MLRLRKWQLENQGKATAAVLVGRVAGTTVITFSWQPEGEEAPGCRIPRSLGIKKQGGRLLRGARLLWHCKEGPQRKLTCAIRTRDRCAAARAPHESTRRGGFCLAVSELSTVR